MKYLLCAVLLLPCLASFAQDARQLARQYEERQAANKRSEERIHQQYINNLPNNPGAKPASGSWLANQQKSQQEIQQWLDSRKRTSATDYEPSEELARQNRNRRAADHEKEQYLREVHMPFARMLQKEGFQLFEGFHMAELFFDHERQSLDSINRVLNVARYAKYQFDQLAATAGFDELVRLAFQFKVAGYSAITAIESLKKRFPDKSDDIDMVMVQLLPALGDYSPKVGMDYLMEQRLDPEAWNRSIEIFKYLLQKYPVETARADASSRDSPSKKYHYKMWLQESKDREAKAGLFLYILQAAEAEKPLARTARYFEEGYKVAFDRLQLATDFFQYEKNEKYINRLTLSDWKKIAQDKGLPVLDLMTGMHFYRPCYRLEDYRYSQDKGYEETPAQKKFGYGTLVKKLAEEGDPDAMNAYAVRIAAGLVKGVPRKDAVTWLYKAVDAGSFMGAMNLNLARDWDIAEYMTESNLEMADARIHSFFDKASDKDNFEAAMLFCKNNWPDIMQNDGRQRLLARRFLNHAARNGYPPAMQVLATYPPLKQ